MSKAFEMSWESLTNDLDQHIQKQLVMCFLALWKASGASNYLVVASQVIYFVFESELTKFKLMEFVMLSRSYPFLDEEESQNVRDFLISLNPSCDYDLESFMAQDLGCEIADDFWVSKKYRGEEIILEELINWALRGSGNTVFCLKPLGAVSDKEILSCLKEYYGKIGYSVRENKPFGYLATKTLDDYFLITVSNHSGEETPMIPVTVSSGV